MEIIKTNNYRKLITSFIPVGVGSSATCYKMKDNKVLKIYRRNNYSNEILSNKDFENELIKISELSNETIVGPEKLLYINGKLCGYIYPYIKAPILSKLKKDTKIKDIFKNYEVLLENVKRISDANLTLKDVHKNNILFDGYFHIIDLDRSTFDLNARKDNILDLNITSIINAIMFYIFNIESYEIPLFINFNYNSYIYSPNISDINTIYNMINELSWLCNNNNPTIDQVRSKVRVYKRVNN